MLSYKISIIGSGNLATRLAPELENAGHRIVEVCSRNPKNAKSLIAKLYNAAIKYDYDFTQSVAEIIIIAVSDDAIEEVAKEVALNESMILVHTSGTRSLDLLSYAAADHKGVFYPLQTFSKTKRVEFDHIPILLEASDDKTMRVLQNLAGSISKKTVPLNSEQRKAVHVAAVFSCNLVNHLFRVAEEILAEKKLTFDLLGPLIVETVNKSLALGPASAQTGPAVREDYETLDAHMEYLKDDLFRSEIYRMISQDIIDTR